MRGFLPSVCNEPVVALEWFQFIRNYHRHAVSFFTPLPELQPLPLYYSGRVVCVS